MFYEDLLDLVHDASAAGSSSASPLFEVFHGKCRALQKSRPHRSLETSLLSQEYTKPGVLRWHNFFAGLEDWGFTVHRNRQTDSEAALAREQSKALSTFRADTAVGIGVGMHPHNSAEERLQWKRAQQELQRAAIIREARKQELFAQRLKDRITTEYHIYPSFGKRLFFELKVENPYGREEMFVIHADDPKHELRVVTDEDEWRFLRRVLPRCCGDVGDTPIEDGMVSADNELLLAPRETVYVPFTFLSLASGLVKRRGGAARHNRQSRRRNRRRGAGGAGDSDSEGEGDVMMGDLAAFAVPMLPRTIHVTIVGQRSQQAVALLKVHIHPRPFVIDRSVHFYNAEHEVMKRTVIIQPGDGPGFDVDGGTWDGLHQDDALMGKFAYCTDDNVVCSSQSGTVRGWVVVVVVVVAACLYGGVGWMCVCACVCGCVGVLAAGHVIASMQHVLTPHAHAVVAVFVFCFVCCVGAARNP